MIQPLRSVALALLVAACSSNPSSSDGGHDASVDLSAIADGGGGGDGPTATSCAATGTPRAVVIASSSDMPEVRVMTQLGGTLVDHGLSFTGIDDPEQLAMRPDGAEAVFSYGGFGNPYGVRAVTLAPDGTSATLGPAIQLGTDLTPVALAYVTPDRLLLAASAMDHYLITLERRNGTFVETARVQSPGSFPLMLAHRAGTEEAVMPRADVGTDPSTGVFLMAPVDGGVYAATGSAAMVTPDSLMVALHPSGAIGYSPTSNASDPVTASHLDGTGSLFVLGVAASGVSSVTTLMLPRPSDVIAVDPAGRLAVMDGPIFELDPNTQTPIVHNYVLFTLPLDGSGMPGTLLPESAQFPALLFNDLALTPSGHLLVSLEMYPDLVPASMEHPLELRAMTAPGQWDVCQRLYLPGAGHVAVAGGSR